MRLLFRQAARRIAAMTIGAAEHDMRGRVHRLDAVDGIECSRRFLRRLAPGFDRSRLRGRESDVERMTDVSAEQKWVGRNRIVGILRNRKFAKPRKHQIPITKRRKNACELS